MDANLEQSLWDAYNLLLSGPDVERLRKILVRYELFRRTIELPGDIVEAGVLKGAGLMLWLKLLDIFAHGSLKRVVGFDLFEGWEASATGSEKAIVAAMVAETGFRGVTPESILARADAAGLRERTEIVAGDIAKTAPEYLAAYPGFRISLLHLDMDHEEPTLAALDALWPRVVRGGIVVFDEYAVPKWSESAGVDRWLAKQAISLQTLPWGRTPTAFVVRP